jgi:hypothetical protein
VSSVARTAMMRSFALACSPSAVSSLASRISALLLGEPIMSAAPCTPGSADTARDTRISATESR